MLGTASWDDAIELCKAYRGGRYDDWHLPTKDELNLIYQNLKKNEKISGNDWHWSSSQENSDSAWFQRFSDGKQDHYLYRYDYFGFEEKSSKNKHTGCCVRAVRAF